MISQQSEAAATGRPATTPAVESEHATTASVQPQTVIVPRRPAALRVPQPPTRRQRHELEDLVDDIFGPPIDESPGRFDAGLVLVGLGLAAWTVVGDGPSLTLPIGMTAIVLGLALPVRAMLRWFRSQAVGLRRRVVEPGIPLDASHPATLALIDAHARLLQSSTTRTARKPELAIAAGHSSVIEVSRLLEGRPPSTPAEIRLVSTRTAALHALTDQMLRPDDRRPGPIADHAPARVPGPPSPPLRTPVQSPSMPPRAPAPPHPGYRDGKSGRRQ